MFKQALLVLTVALLVPVGIGLLIDGEPGPALMVLLLAALAANPIVRSIRKARYFASEDFQTLRASAAALIAEHNDVVGYVSEIRTGGAFELGASDSGRYAHLATFENTSSWSYRRDRNVATYAPHVHNASLQVVRNASAEPIKYVMKYFSIKADKETLTDVQRLSADIARLEGALANVKEREADLTAKMRPPKFILKHYAEEFWDQIGAQLSPVEVPYPQYRFEYTSAGGNAGQTAGLVFNTPTLEALAETLAAKIRWAKSAAGQRALMTTKLRTAIKARDNHTCQNCGISLQVEPHLLLEVDHIMPVSRGGLSIPENLQTLCWKCNRAKGARVPIDPASPPTATQSPVATLPPPPPPAQPLATSRPRPQTPQDHRAARQTRPTTTSWSGDREIPFAEAHARGPMFSYGGPHGRRGGPGRSEHRGPYAVIDLETTGFSPRRGSRVIEFAVTRIDERGHIEDEYATLVNPDGADTGPVFVHGISNDAVRDAPRFSEVAGELLSRLDGAVVVAHNAPFEEHFLSAELARAGLQLTSPLPALCTLWLAQHTLQTPNHRLPTLCRHFGVPLVDKHAALGDARAVSALLPLLLRQIDQPLVYSVPTRTGLAPNHSAGAVTPKTRAVALRKGSQGWMASLMDRLPMSAAEATGPQATVYLDELAEVLEDGRIVGVEAERLSKIAGAAGMGAAQVADLHGQFLDGLLEVALEDGALSPSELRDLRRTAALLGQPDKFAELVTTPAPGQLVAASPVSTLAQPPGSGVDRSTRARLAVQQQQSGMSRDAIAEAHGLSAATIKEYLRDGKFYVDPSTDPYRLDLASSAYSARTAGVTKAQFRLDAGLSAARASEAWRDSIEVDVTLLTNPLT